MLNQFSEKFKLFLIDMRGHGESSDIPGPYGNFEYTGDIIEVFDKENIKNAHFWATHTGTGAGLAIAVKRPELIKSLILEGPVIPDVKMDRTNEIIARAKHIAKTEGVQRAIDDWLENADWYSYMKTHKQETNAEEHRTLVNQFTGKPWLSELVPKPAHAVYSQLKDINQPVLIYNGLYDLNEFKQIADTLEASLKIVVRKVISDAGGFPLWENPNEVITVVKEFLESNI